jgi:hypothetical protein
VGRKSRRDAHKFHVLGVAPFRITPYRYHFISSKWKKWKNCKSQFELPDVLRRGYPSCPALAGRIHSLLSDRDFRRRISSDHPRDDLLKPRLGTEHIERRLDHDKREFARVLQGSQRTLDIIERGIDDGDVV